MATAVQMKYDSPVAVEYSRKKWFLNIQKIVKIFVKRPRYIYLGDKPGPQCIILTNHEGASVPLTMEMYGGVPARFWGTFEMDKNFKTAYQYQTVRYYHGKKNWNIWPARLFCLLATPLTRLFYMGLELIPTYPDMRFKNTLSRSIHFLQKGNTLVIFPENSDDGYHKVITEFRPGVVMLLEQCQRHGLDVPVYVAYYKKGTRQHVFDKPATVGQLLGLGLDRRALTERLRSRCNELGKMEFAK